MKLLLKIPTHPKRVASRACDSRVAPLFHWVATLGKLFTHIASRFSALRNWGYKREFSAPKWLWWLSVSLD